VASAIADIRNGVEGPVFIEVETYRWLEHVGPRDDHEDEYRDGEVYKRWIDSDQIERLEKMLDADTVVRIQNEIQNEIQQSEEFADKSPYPAAEELYTHVYAD
jgi:pyruvate dehydrogenase E1 component alpha subunit